MKASVIVLNFNGLEDTKQCVHSLLSDGYPDKEVIVWDNASHSSEADELRRLFPDITVIRNSENLFYAGGNNQASEHAQGDILIFLNNDTEVTPGWLPPLLAAFENSEIAACQPKIISWHQRERFDYAGGCGGFFDCLGFPFTRGRVITTLEEDRGQYDGNWSDLDWVSGACFAVRREAFFQAGMFDADFGIYAEELDLSWRLRNLGWKLGCVSASVIYHKGGKSWLGTADGPCFYRHRNNLLTLLKNASQGSLVWLFVRRLLLEIIAPLFYVCCGNVAFARAPARSLLSFLRLRRVFFLKRTKASDGIKLAGKPFLLWRYYVKGQRTYAAIHAAD